jgi:hypothetical protein
MRRERRGRDLSGVRLEARVTLALAALCGLSSALSAQATGMRAPPAPGFAAILGVVDDSIRGKPLIGATVTVLGTTRTAVTGPDGLFRIDSIPPGETLLYVKHPLLDTLFISVTAKAVFTADKLEQAAITTPPISVLRDRVCPRTGSMVGQAMIAGRVDDAETEKPIANAVVSLVYTDPTMGLTTQRLRTTRSRPDGFYVICGLPETINGTVQASVGATSSSEIPISARAEVITTASFLLNPAAKADSGVRGIAVLRGRVTDAAGKPVKDAQVAVEGGNNIATTADDGSYTLSGLGSGTTQAVIRRIGYAPAFRTVHLRSSQPQMLNVALSAGVTTLGEVKVTAPLEPALKKVGFTERRMMGMRSNFLTPEDLDKRPAARFTDLVRNLAGFRVTLQGNGAFIESNRAVPGQSSCVAIFVDRVAFEQMTPGDLDNAFPAYQIGAIEAYASATDTPAEFRMSGKNCATIVAWTRHRLAKP